MRQIALALLLLQLHIAQAEPATAPTRPGTTLSIISTASPENFDATQMLHDGKIPGFAIIQQQRSLDLQEGENNLDLPDIAPTADFSTLSLRSLTPDAFKVLSQTLRQHPSEPEAILARAIGREIIINRKQGGTADRARAPETINAKLLAFDQHQLVVETKNHQLPVQIIPRNSEIAEIKLMADSAAPITRPAIACKIIAREAGPQDALLTYRANKISWHADYEILLNNDNPTAQFTSAITIINLTGASFEDSAINLLRPQSTTSYSLPKPATLPANAAQRIPLVDAPNTPTQTILACGPLDYAHTPTFATTYLAIDNTSKNGLALSLPPGKIRILRQNILLSDTAFPGSDPNNLILLRIGPASSVNVKREIQSRLDTDHLATVIDFTQITLRNPSDQPQRIILIEPPPPASGEILEKSDPFEKQSHSLLFTVDVPANGEKILTYSLRHPAQ